MYSNYALTLAAREQQRAERSIISPVRVMAPQEPKVNLCRWQTYKLNEASVILLYINTNSR